MMVCKSWSEMGEDPKMWTWSVVRVNSREDFQKLKIKRLQLLAGDQTHLSDGQLTHVFMDPWAVTTDSFRDLKCEYCNMGMKGEKDNNYCQLCNFRNAVLWHFGF